MELDKILKLIDAVSDSSLTSFSFDDGNVKLTFGADRGTAKSADNGVDRSVEAVAENMQTLRIPAEAPAGNMQKTQKSAETDTENAATDSSQDMMAGNIVKSPLVGIYYSANAPEDEPLVKVGDVVKKGQILGIVEAMKLMNEIESDYDGVVKQILIDNQQMVEYGQPMFVIA
jgi:acetyl-CoA carboxylase biotin carboxyl carrier protein